jgi:hypothetical protein
MPSDFAASFGDSAKGVFIEGFLPTNKIREVELLSSVHPSMDLSISQYLIKFQSCQSPLTRKMTMKPLQIKASESIPNIPLKTTRHPQGTMRG